MGNIIGRKGMIERSRERRNEVGIGNFGGKMLTYIHIYKCICLLMCGITDDANWIHKHLHGKPGTVVLV